MNRRELVKAIAAHTSQDVQGVDATLTGLTEVITAVVAKGEPVAIQGFAKFTKVHRSARIGRNPQTGEPVKIKAKTVAKATAMKAFRETVMAPSSAPRLARGVWPTSLELLAAQAQERKASAGAASATAKRAPAKKVPAKRAPAKKASAKRAPAKKASAKRAPAKRASAKRAPAKRATAKRAPAKRAPAKRATARKAPSRRR